MKLIFSIANESKSNETNCVCIILCSLFLEKLAELPVEAVKPVIVPSVVNKWDGEDEDDVKVIYI